MGGLSGISYYQGAYSYHTNVLFHRRLQVRLWTLNGQYIGHFGQTTPWDLKNLHNFEKSQEKLIPHDVKRVASSTTLMVIKMFTLLY